MAWDPVGAGRNGSVTRAEVHAGVCGFCTTIEASSVGDRCGLTIHSACSAVQRLADVLTDVDPFAEISTRGGMPDSLRLGAAYCTHAACPVPVAIIKAVEVESGLALPADVTISLARV